MIKIGQKYRHNNGNIYTVILLANVNSENPKYPLTVVYKNVNNGTVWSRPASDWDRSFTLISDIILDKDGIEILENDNIDINGCEYKVFKKEDGFLYITYKDVDIRLNIFDSKDLWSLPF